MRKILLFLVLIISINSFGQNIPGYQTRQVREKLIAMSVDSGLHIPRYNGTPSGVRTGVYVADGAIAMDTTNHRLYIYSGGAWVRLASFSEIVGAADTSAMLTPYLRGATAGYGMLITGSQHKTWTVDSFSLATRAALYKVSDSLGALISAGNTIYTGDGTLAGNRQVTMDGKSLSFINSGENKLVVNPVSDSYSFGDGDGAAANINISSSTYSTNFSGVNFSKFTYTGRQWLIGDVDDNWDGIKLQMDNSGVTKYGSLTFGDSTHILIDDANHFFKFLTRESERVRLNESGILIPNGIMPTSGSGGTDSAWFRNSSTGQTYLAPGGGGGISAADLPLRITGSTVSADTSVAYSPSLATNARVMQIVDSLKALGWGAQVPAYDPWYSKKIDYGMWGGGSGFDDEDMQTVSGGTGSSATGQSSGLFAGWMGAVKFITGTTSAGYGHSFFSNGSSAFAQIVMDSLIRMNYGAKLRIDALSDGTDRFAIVAGFSDNTITPTSVLDGCFFRYSDADSSGVWIMCVYRNGVKIEDATATTVAINTDYELEISVYQGTSFFYINDVLVGSITPTAAQFLTGAGVPYGETRSTGISVGIGKTLGTTARNMWVDWVQWGTRKN